MRADRRARREADQEAVDRLDVEGRHGRADIGGDGLIIPLEMSGNAEQGK